MACLYVTEQGSSLTVSGDKIVVKCKSGLERLLPVEIVESIMIFGTVLMTTQAIKVCLEKKISVTFLSTKGGYFGRLESTTGYNGERLKKQVYLSDDPQSCLEFSGKVLKAKVHNQLILLRRYARSHGGNIEAEAENVFQCEKKIETAQSIQEVMGYEGMAAREYFKALSKLIIPEFAFNGRTKRPPKDSFNAMLSLGYTILFYEIYAELEARSLMPYIGLIHKLKAQHPALVSDLLEEWRAVIVDAVVMSLVQGREISTDMFSQDLESGAVLLSNAGVKILVEKLEKKMRSDMHYLSYLDRPVSFRRAIWHQVKRLAACIDAKSFADYIPLKIR